MTANIKLWLGPALAAGLLCVWPIGHTIALRNLLLVAALAWMLIGRAGLRAAMVMQGPALVWIAFLAWAGVSAAVMASPHTTGEFSGQLLTATAAGAFGLALGSRLASDNRFALGWTVIMAPLLLHLVATTAAGLGPLLAGEPLARRVGGLTEGPDKSNYLTAIVVCGLLVEAWLRREGRRFSVLPNAVVFGALALAAMALYVEMIRNGLLSVAAALVLLLAYAFATKRITLQVRHWITAGVILAAMLATAATDPRWRGTADAFKTAWHSDARAIVLGAQAALPDVKDPSAWLRAAMLKEGLALVAAHPLGIGFHRNAFGHGLSQAYGAGAGHSHSSLLDIAIGTGVPGLLLSMGFFLLLIRTGWTAERQRGDGIGLLLMLLAGATLARAAVDSNLRDHMLQMDLFLFGVLLGALAVPQRRLSQ